MKPTREQSRRILDAIADCERFIAKEDHRRADLRPASIQQHLDFCKSHKVKLQLMLTTGEGLPAPISFA
jgi:hypothetical protein